MKSPRSLSVAAVLGGALILVLLIGLWLPRDEPRGPGGLKTAAPAASDTGPLLPGSDATAGMRSRKKLSADQIVARKLVLFAKKHRLLVHRIADYYHVGVPPDVDRFFTALEAGNWEEAKAIFKTLRGTSGGAPAELSHFWRPIVEAYGAGEQVHLWPAQQLLDYGNSILGSLRPDMVYVGGTDSGCFIPTMLNETSDGGQHVVLTQNALADNSYLDYLRFLYGDQISTLTTGQSQQAFEQYLSDAQKRLEHDQQFPDEPRQIQPGENVQMENGHLSVSGQVAVMAINGLLLQNLLQQNPDVSFAMEESFPIKSTYAGSAPLGPIMELRAGGGQSPITPDDAQQSVNYWQTAAQNLTTAADAPPSDAALQSYAHDAAAQANLLANNNYPDAAEQTYQTALDLWSDDLGTVGAYATFLAGQGRTDEGNDLLDIFLQNNPGQSAEVNALRATLLPRVGRVPASP